MADGAVKRLTDLVESLRARRNRELSRCARACFFDELGALTSEGERLLAEIRNHAKLFGSSIVRDRQGRIDTEEMLRMEGRREVALWLINLLELDPSAVARFVEVDNGQD